MGIKDLRQRRRIIWRGGKGIPRLQFHKHIRDPIQFAGKKEDVPFTQEKECPETRPPFQIVEGKPDLLKKFSLEFGTGREVAVGEVLKSF